RANASMMERAAGGGATSSAAAPREGVRWHPGSTASVSAAPATNAGFIACSTDSLPGERRRCRLSGCALDSLVLEAQLRIAGAIFVSSACRVAISPRAGAWVVQHRSPAASTLPTTGPSDRIEEESREFVRKTGAGART